MSHISLPQKFLLCEFLTDNYLFCHWENEIELCNGRILKAILIPNCQMKQDFSMWYIM